ncbi:BUD13 homolog isoform X1 [Crassostrea angulata]|uniref:BUD13 homolog isoform X1 n=1 Tax=Magallana angulata TaxID=2784310 RepID=UPI0022B0FBF3|nr:BUD13 homolog isoform X1 [Crassostrea angulata]
MSTLSKSEYLKRYTSDADVPHVKRKRKDIPENFRMKKSRIFDDDIDIKTLPSSFEDSTAYDNIEENIPIIAAVIDERPKHIQCLEAYKTNKWKGVTLQSDSCASPQRKKRNDSDSDAPPGKERNDSDSDASSPKKGRNDSDSDASPPRKGRNDFESDASPPRRGRNDFDSDASPPRKERSDSDPDASPPRKGRSDSDASPQGKERNDSDSDVSPQRRPRNLSDDLPQGNVSIKEESNKNQRYRAKANDKMSNKGRNKNIQKTLSGKMAGLSSAKDLKREADIIRKKEDETFKQINSKLLGENAVTQYRKSGRQQKKKCAEPTQEEIKQTEKLDARYDEWGKGMKQKEEKAIRLEDHVYEMTKPLARSKDDQDLDTMLKDQERADDPMLTFIKKKKLKGLEKKALPKYKGPPPPPNRFGIMAGYRWDGVDRSNGFERSIYAKTSDKKAVELMAYKWSVEDM